MPKKETMPGKKPAAYNTNPRVVIAIAFAMLAVIVIAVVIGSNAFSRAGSTVSVNLPLIETKLTRPSTGEEFNVQTLFSVILDENVRDEVSDDLLTQELASIMQEMDIERILGKGKVDYINSRATELLTEHLAAQGINPRVVLVDLATDDRVTLESPDGNSSDIMNGLFQNMD